MKKKGKQTQK